MKLTLSQQRTLPSVAADMLIVSAQSKLVPRDSRLAELDQAFAGELSKALRKEKFEGKQGQGVTLHSLGRLAARKLRVIGLSKEAAPARAAHRLGVLAGRASRTDRKLCVVAPGTEPEVIRALAEGLVLGAYQYTAYRTEKGQTEAAATIALGSAPTKAQRRALAEGIAVAESVCLARDLVNCPPNDMNATALANAAKRAAQPLGIKCTIWGKKQIEKAGMRLLSAVNAGSREEPRFIHLAYTPATNKATKTAKAANAAKTKAKTPRLVFVGKGLTFDAGGLCLKPGKSMEAMKCDMAGAAATIGIIIAAARLKLPVEVHAVIPSTDNMLGDNAYRPGDVYKSLDGKTVEIINTDAEGRLILADALAYARKLKPTVLIDHATLTGASMVALGQWTGSLFSNRDELRSKYADAAQAAGESYWGMPLTEDLRDSLKSPIADLKHTGDPYGGSISAALFLREFIGDAPWVHLDIAGPSFLPGPHGLEPKGGTGFGVRTGVEFIRSYA